MPKKGSKYTSISIPVSLVMKIREIVESGDYSSVAEFVRDACRRHLSRGNNK